jgi:hypothetical protein
MYHHVVADGFLDDPGQRENIETLLDTALNDQMVNLIARALLNKKATNDQPALRGWYDDNRERYQSRVSLLVNHVVVSPTELVEEQANSLRTLALGYSGGDLENSTELIPDSTASRTWVGIADLDAYHPKVKASLLALDPPACAPVFHLNNALHLFCLEDRKEPQQLSFEEARGKVIEDYITANEQELYTRIKEEILNRVDFEFNETRVREILHAPAAADE